MQFVRELPSAATAPFSMEALTGRDLRGGSFDDYGRPITSGLGKLPADVYSRDQLAQAKPSDFIAYSRPTANGSQDYYVPAWLASRAPVETGRTVEMSAGIGNWLTGFTTKAPEADGNSYMYFSTPLRAPSGFANTNPEDVYATPWTADLPDTNNFIRLKADPFTQQALSLKPSALNGHEYDILDSAGNVKGKGVFSGLTDGDHTDELVGAIAAAVATFGASAAASAGAAAASEAAATESASFAAANTAPYFEVSHALGDVVTLGGNEIMASGSLAAMGAGSFAPPATELPYFEVTHSMGDVINLGGSELFQAGSLATGTLIPAVESIATNQAIQTAAQTAAKTLATSSTPTLGQVIDVAKTGLGLASVASALGGGAGGGAGGGVGSVPRASGSPAGGGAQNSGTAAAGSGGVSGGAASGFLPASVESFVQSYGLPLLIVGAALYLGSQ